MLSADSLFLLERDFDEYNSQDPERLVKIVYLLNKIYNLREYQNWLNDGQYHSSYSQSCKFFLPNNFGTDLTTQDKNLLNNLKLINSGQLEVKIDKHDGKIHLTDGSWVDPKIRVYPFTDESSIIYNYFRNNCDSIPDLLIDPACGCGHHGLALNEIETKISLDINLRSIAYCRINALISGMPQMLTGLNDIRVGIPKPIDMVSSNSTLITINMPFAIFPKLSTVLAQDGGDRGIALTLSALNAVKKFSNSAKNILKIRAIVLFYSLGSLKDNQWEVVDNAFALFGKDRVKFKILTDEKMWRVNGKKEQSNPMPIEFLEKKAECRHTYTEVMSDQARLGFISLKNIFIGNGFSHLAYGILDIDCK